MARRPRLAPPPDPLTTTDVTILETEPVCLAPGHPLQGARCLICAMTIGGQPQRTITCVDYRLDGCTCGALIALTFMVCADHKLPDDATLHHLAMARWGAHHFPAAP